MKDIAQILILIIIALLLGYLALYKDGLTNAIIDNSVSKNQALILENQKRLEAKIDKLQATFEEGITITIE